jgi:adenylylsulfate kinase-like enzyme
LGRFDALLLKGNFEMSINIVNVQINSNPAVGKSVVAEIIAQALEVHGISVELVDDSVRNIVQNSLVDRIDAIKNKNVVVKISTLPTKQA